MRSNSDDGCRRTAVDWAVVRRELLVMAGEDRRVRAELAADGSLFDGYHPRMQAVHDRNAVRLAEIVELHGWPAERLAGTDGAEAAWLIVQHAIARPEFQRAALGFLRSAVDTGDAPGWQAAMLEDRIRVFEGRMQRYGTQLDWDATGELNPLPIENPAGVDERRSAVGLGPLAAATEARRKAAAREGEGPPSDFEARESARQRWLRELGWRV